MFWAGKRGFTLTELLIAVVLTGLIVLAVTSVDITCRKFLRAASRESRVQDEARIAMEHIVKNVQLGIGDMTNPRDLDVGFVATPSNCSRGFYILDAADCLISSGSRIQIKRDGLKTGNVDGMFDSTGSDDGIIEYRYDSANHKIVYDPDIGLAGDEDLTDKIITNTNFELIRPNGVKVTIEALRDPLKAESPENPKTTLTSSVVLRAMSTN